MIDGWVSNGPWPDNRSSAIDSIRVGFYGLRRLCPRASGFELDGLEYLGQSSARARILGNARPDSINTEVNCQRFVVAITPESTARSVLTYNYCQNTTRVSTAPLVHIIRFNRVFKARRAESELSEVLLTSPKLDYFQQSLS